MFFRSLFWYALPSSLVSVQDSIMVRNRISPEEALVHIKTIRVYNHFFYPWFGLNPIAKGEISIRQLMILSVMYHLRGNHSLGFKCKAKAEKMMLWAIHNKVHITNPIKFELAEKSFDFYAWVFGSDSFYSRLKNLEINF